MATQIRQQATFEAFESFIQLPENYDRRFEYIAGEIVEVPSNAYASLVAARIITLISMFLLQSKHKGHVTGEGGGYVIDGQVIAPDAAYIYDLPARSGFEHTPPVLAVEVISDPGSSAEQTDLRRKLAHYRRAGVVVWVVDHVLRQVDIHVPDATVKVYSEGETISGGDMLPGFALPVSDIFPTDGA